MFFFGTLTEINVIHIEVLPPIVLVHVKDQWCRVPQKKRHLTLEKNTILMDFLVYGNRKCLWIRCMFGYCRTLITIARVNCILGLMQMLMADCFSYVF